MDVKYVSTVTSTDSTGKPVEAIPVRAWAAGETDNAGKPVGAIPVTISATGKPVRLVAGKTAQNSIGQWLDTIPISGEGAYILPTPILVEDFESLTGFAFANGFVNQAIVSSPKIGGAGSMFVEANGVAGTYTATKTLPAQYDISQLGIVAYPIYIGTRGQNQVYPQFGRSGTYYSPAVIAALADRTPGWRWIAFAVSSPPAGVGQTELRMRGAAVAPWNMKLNFDRIYANAKGRPTFVFGFDDGMRSTYDVAFPYMRSKGIVGTIYVPWSQIGDTSGTRQTNKLITPELQEMAAAGWAICLDGTGDDSVMVAKADPVACWAELQAGQAWLAARGFDPEGGKHFCYPNGYYEGDSGGNPIVPTQIAVMTGDGSTTVTFGAAVTLTTGQTIRGYGVQDNTKVVTGGVGVTSAVLDKTVPVQTKPAEAVDESGPFYRRKLGDYLQAQGMKSGRVTEQDETFSRFGFGDQQMFQRSRSTSNTSFTTHKAFMDNALALGATYESYTHALVSVGAGINEQIDQFQQRVDYAAAARDAGLADCLTKPQWINRDLAAIAPN